MLYVQFKEFRLALHVGEKVSSRYSKAQDLINDVVSVQADGDELDLACRILGRTSIGLGAVHSFYGAFAQEIVGNWK